MLLFTPSASITMFNQVAPGTKDSQVFIGQVRMTLFRCHRVQRWTHPPLSSLLQPPSILWLMPWMWGHLTPPASFLTLHLWSAPTHIVYLKVSLLSALYLPFLFHSHQLGSDSDYLSLEFLHLATLLSGLPSNPSHKEQIWLNLPPPTPIKISQWF